MDYGLIQIALFFLICVLILGPKETSRLAHKLGRWMREIQKMSQEFTRELTREADAIEERERTLEIEQNIFATGQKAEVEDLSGYHPIDESQPEVIPAGESAAISGETTTEASLLDPQMSGSSLEVSASNNGSPQSLPLEEETVPAYETPGTHAEP